MELVACARCNRHVRVSAARCPFCSAARQPTGIGRLVDLGGRLSRAAVFAGAAACYTNPPATQNPPPPPPPPDGDVQQQQPPPPGDGFAKPPDGDATTTTTTTTTTTAPATGTISGVVRSGDTNAPLPNVRVNLGGQTTVTGSDGRYEFKNVPPGQYEVELQGNGNPRQPPPSVWVEVKAGATAQADIATYPQIRVRDRGPCCKPYGAPPARRRVV